MDITYKLEPSEIENLMQYIGEVFRMGSGITKTGRAKRLYAQIIGDKDDLAVRMIERCKYVHGHGMKSPIYLDGEELAMLKLLEKYVWELTHSC